MKRLTPFILAASVITGLFVGVTVAQQKQTADAPSGIALKIVFEDGTASYNPVPNSKGTWAWYGRFQRVASWKPPVGSDPVEAVKFAYVMEGGAVRVKVSVLLGKFHDKEEPVAAYLAHENEEISVDELKRFGVVPFKMTVVRVNTLIPSPPPVVSQAKSLEVINVQANVTTLPSYKLLLRNMSAKNIITMEINTMVGSKKRYSTWPGGGGEGVVIEAGATYETDIKGADAGRVASGVLTPAAPANQSIVISTVVFEDGTYEGDAAYAAVFTARTSARKVQLTRARTLLKNALEAPDPEGAAVVERFKSQASSLAEDVDPALMDKLLKQFPPLDGFTRRWMEAAFQDGLHDVMRELLDDLDKFEENNQKLPGTISFRTWLSDTERKYEKQAFKF